jgi:hypothetical protein
MNQHVVPAAATAVAITDAAALWVALVERAARDPEISVDRLERMLQMRAAEEARQAERLFRQAMAACQAELASVRTDSANPQTKSRYASLAAVDAAVRPSYAANGFSLSFDTADIQKPDHVRVLCVIAHASGHTETRHIDLPCDGKGARGNDVMTKTHAMGSAITYARRYLLGMIFGIAVERDDDGNTAGRRYEQQPRPMPGKHADGQDNRFYREPPHDPQTGEIIEGAALADDEAANEARKAFISATRERIRTATSAHQLGTWWNSAKQKQARRDFDLTPEEVANLVAFVKARLDTLKRPAEAAE